MQDRAHLLSYLKFDPDTQQIFPNIAENRDIYPAPKNHESICFTLFCNNSNGNQTSFLPNSLAALHEVLPYFFTLMDKTKQYNHEIITQKFNAFFRQIEDNYRQHPEIQCENEPEWSKRVPKRTFCGIGRILEHLGENFRKNKMYGDCLKEYGENAAAISRHFAFYHLARSENQAYNHFKYELLRECYHFYRDCKAEFKRDREIKRKWAQLTEQKASRASLPPIEAISRNGANHFFRHEHNPEPNIKRARIMDPSNPSSSGVCDMRDALIRKDFSYIRNILEKGSNSYSDLKNFQTTLNNDIEACEIILSSPYHYQTYTYSADERTKDLKKVELKELRSIKHLLEEKIRFSHEENHPTPDFKGRRMV